LIEEEAFTSLDNTATDTSPQVASLQGRVEVRMVDKAGS